MNNNTVGVIICLRNIDASLYGRVMTHTAYGNTVLFYIKVFSTKCSVLNHRLNCILANNVFAKG